LSIRLTPGAEADLAAIHAFIAENNRVAADRIARRILESIGALENFPFLGRAGRIPGTRAWSIAGTRYICVYRVAGADVEVLALVHTSRNWP
jgi:plasmid stabilization system protein ParE